MTSPPERPRAPSRRVVLVGLAGVVLAIVGLVLALRRPFPSDHTPEGAYMRIAKSAAADDPAQFFAYLETEAQWACFTLRNARRDAHARILATYPEPQRSELAGRYGALATAADGSDAFAVIYRDRKWSGRLRKDLSGVVKVEIDGDRATVVTARGTRYPFRRRDNGIWGLTVFTAELLAEAEKATRDLAVVNAAAADYDRAKR